MRALLRPPILACIVAALALLPTAASATWSVIAVDTRTGVVVIASAFIPHFWVVSTTLLLTLMAVVALRELLYHDDFT